MIASTNACQIADSKSITKWLNLGEAGQNVEHSPVRLVHAQVAPPKLQHLQVGNFPAIGLTEEL